MRIYKITLVLLLLSSISLIAQNSEEIWGIGTKWTYEFQLYPNDFSYLTHEIIDTTLIDGLKLYEVETLPSIAYSGIQYFYYEEGKVYNYDTNQKILQLLYDFDNEEGYWLDYRPVCDLFFNYDSLISRKYHAVVKDISEYEMPDGSTRNLQHMTVTDTVTEVDGSQILVPMNKEVLSNIGFTRGFLHHSHDWELGLYICDESGNYISDLRCFENDSVSYNFKKYPCDSTLVLTNTKEIKDASRIKLYPNPTNGIVKIDNWDSPQEYQVYDIRGVKIKEGVSQSGSINLELNGINIIHFRIDDETWEYARVLNMKNSR